jgi:hypothetical protein
MELGSKTDHVDFGQEADNATTEGNGEEASGEHGINGSKQRQTKQGEGGATKLIGHAIQTRRLVEAASSTAAAW